ncbi:hypothetical protein L9F63_025957, partial [Diploptera punctata]
TYAFMCQHCGLFSSLVLEFLIPNFDAFRVSRLSLLSIKNSLETERDHQASSKMMKII